VRFGHTLSKKVGLLAKILTDNSALWTQDVFLTTGRLKGGNKLAQGKASAAPGVTVLAKPSSETVERGWRRSRHDRPPPLCRS
jgi:hypothetical protein